MVEASPSECSAHHPVEDQKHMFCSIHVLLQLYRDAPLNVSRLTLVNYVAPKYVTCIMYGGFYDSDVPPYSITVTNHQSTNPIIGLHSHSCQSWHTVQLLKAHLVT